VIVGGFGRGRPAVVVTTDGKVYPVEDDRLAAITAQLDGQRGYNTGCPGGAGIARPYAASSHPQVGQVT